MTGAPEPAAVLAAFGVPGRAVAMGEVSGAWSNRLYRLDTDIGRYAVKQILDPWGDTGWQAWLDVAWRFEQEAFAAGVDMPRPIPNPADGGCLAWVEQSAGGDPVPVRLHRWVDGGALGPGPVDRAVAEWAGGVLATLHGLRFQPTEHAVFPALDTESADQWPRLVRAAVDARAPWAGLLMEVESVVSAVAELVRSAEPSDEPEPMSHGDVDQKNIVGSPRGPVLCDWDASHPVVPRQEVVHAAMSLSGWKRVHVARAVFAAYESATRQRIDVRPADLGPSMMRSLDWIRFNVERAIGARAGGPAERDISSGLVPGLLRQLTQQTYVARQVRELLAH